MKRIALGFLAAVVVTTAPGATVDTTGNQASDALPVGHAPANKSPRILEFDAAVIYVSYELPFVGTLETFIPVVKATVKDADGVSTVTSLTVTSTDGSDTVLPVVDGNAYGYLPPLSSFSGGTFSAYATDSDGATSKSVDDDIAAADMSAPAIEDPVSGSDGVSLTQMLDWNDVDGASAYLLHVSTESPENEDNITDWETGVLGFLADENSVVKFTDGTMTQSYYRTPKGLLQPETQYWWAVGALDKTKDTDYITVSLVANFTTEAGAFVEDVIAPAFTEYPSPQRVTENAVTLTWKTDEAAAARIYYGSEPGVVQDSLVDASLTKTRVISVDALSPGTEYYFTVAVTDFAGNRHEYDLPRSVRTSSSGDEEPPSFTVFPVAQQVRETEATFKFVTNEQTTAQIHIVGGEQDTVVVVPDPAKTHMVSVDGLTPGTFYSFEVTVTDLVPNDPVTASGPDFRTADGADTKAPRAVSGPVVIPGTNEAIVYWTADELHTASVNVTLGLNGPTVGAVYSDTPERDQLVRLTGLSPATKYAVRIELVDEAGNSRDLAPNPFKTSAAADTIAPTLIKIPAITYRSSERVVISWTTDEPADGYIQISQNGEFHSEQSDGMLVRRHSFVVTGLAAGATYSFKVSSADAAGNVLNWPDPLAGRLSKIADARLPSLFSTSVTTDNTAPVITSSPVVTSTTATTFTLEWQTDETANSAVYFGPSGGTGKLSRLAIDPQYTQNVVETDAVTGHSVTVTGLNQGGEYLWVASSTDPSGNGETLSSSGKITILDTEDTQPPTITSGPSIIGQTESRLTIRWYTDEPSNSVVRWSKSGTSDAKEEVTDPDLVTDHVVTLTNLSSSTDYDLEVTSKDLIGNTSMASSTTGTTDGDPDATAPRFSDVRITVDAQQAVVTWVTDEPADTWLDYGTSAAYGTVVSKLDFLTSHSLVLTNLALSTQYYFQLASSDASGNIADSTGLTFTTLDAADTTPPARVTGVSAETGAYEVRIAWPASADSNEVAGYIVERASGGAFEEIAGPLTNLTYTDKTVALDTPYEYRILAKDVSALGNLSEPSDTVSVTPTASDAPGAPTPVIYDTLSLVPTLAVESATANKRAIASYSFLVTTDAAMTEVVATGSGVQPETDPTCWEVPFKLNHGAQYWWAAKAVDEAGFTGPLTAAIGFLADSTYAPNAIALTTFTATSSRAMVQVAWELSGSEVLGFHVERGTSGTFERLTETPVTGGPRYEWLDGSVVPGRSYDYRIVALLPDGGTQTFGPVSVTAALPTQVTLHQNAPNPFNPSTSIAYEVPSASNVRLVIYNALGQEVRVLVNRMESAGWYHVTWDGLTSTGTSAASGLYIARLVVGSESGQHTPIEARAIKMMMLR